MKAAVLNTVEPQGSEYSNPFLTAASHLQVKKRKSQASEKKSKNNNVDIVDDSANDVTVHEFEAALGKMVMAFANLEGILTELIVDLADIFKDETHHTRIMALVVGQRFSDLLGRFSAQIQLAAKPESKFLAPLQKWLRAAEKAAATRNRFVHDQLAFARADSGEQPEWVIHRANASRRDGLVMKLRSIGVDEVRQLTTDISDLASGLLKLIDEMVSEGEIPSMVRLVRLDPAAPRMQFTRAGL